MLMTTPFDKSQHLMTSLFLNTNLLWVPNHLKGMFIKWGFYIYVREDLISQQTTSDEEFVLEHRRLTPNGLHQPGLFFKRGFNIYISDNFVSQPITYVNITSLFSNMGIWRWMSYINYLNGAFIKRFLNIYVSFTNYVPTIWQATTRHRPLKRYCQLPSTLQSTIMCCILYRLNHKRGINIPASKINNRNDGWGYKCGWCLTFDVGWLIRYPVVDTPLMYDWSVIDWSYDPIIKGGYFLTELRFWRYTHHDGIDSMIITESIPLDEFCIWWNHLSLAKFVGEFLWLCRRSCCEQQVLDQL